MRILTVLLKCDHVRIKVVVLIPAGDPQVSVIVDLLGQGADRARADVEVKVFELVEGELVEEEVSIAGMSRNDAL